MTMLKQWCYLKIWKTGNFLVLFYTVSTEAIFYFLFSNVRGQILYRMTFWGQANTPRALTYDQQKLPFHCVFVDVTWKQSTSHFSIRAEDHIFNKIQLVCISFQNSKPGVFHVCLILERGSSARHGLIRSGLIIEIKDILILYFQNSVISSCFSYCCWYGLNLNFFSNYRFGMEDNKHDFRCTLSSRTFTDDSETIFTQ